MKKRGQAAMEYLLVVALILLIFVPTTFIFLTNVRKSSNELTESKLYRLGNDIVNTAYEVYYQGVPAKMTLRADMPSNVVDIYVLNNWATGANQFIFIFANERGNETLVFDSDVNINGSFDELSFAKGLKSLIISANISADGTHYANVKII